MIGCLGSVQSHILDAHLVSELRIALSAVFDLCPDETHKVHAVQNGPARKLSRSDRLRICPYSVTLVHLK